MPRVIRDDFFSAPLRINLVEQIGGHDLIKEQFNVEIRMPRFEIITTTQDVNKAELDATESKELMKTTMTHHLTGRQMMSLMRKYGLFDWVHFA